MNLPNKLTMLRIILVPFFIASLLISAMPHNYLVALIIFSVASYTDYLDGKIARERNLISDFGKFLDPLADKILVISAFLCFIELGFCGALPVCILIFREFAVTSIRLVAAGSGKVVAANMWGKIKTVSQIISIIIVILTQYILELDNMGILNLNLYFKSNLNIIFNIIGLVLIWVSTVIAIISGVIYIYQNRKLINSF